jgi:hypothetical protein
MPINTSNNHVHDIGSMVGTSNLPKPMGIEEERLRCQRKPARAEVDVADDIELTSLLLPSPSDML